MPELAAEAEQLGLNKLPPDTAKVLEPASEATREKIALLQKVKFDEPRASRGKTYDDGVFFESLSRQALERGLSARQVEFLDRLVDKYSGQIPDFAALSERLGLHKAPAESTATETELAECRTLLAVMQAVKEWKPAVKRGNRMWDDHKFYASLSKQFADRQTLSPKQIASLKKMAVRYKLVPVAPKFEELQEQTQEGDVRETVAPGAPPPPTDVPAPDAPAAE